MLGWLFVGDSFEERVRKQLEKYAAQDAWLTGQAVEATWEHHRALGGASCDYCSEPGQVALVACYKDGFMEAYRRASRGLRAFVLRLTWAVYAVAIVLSVASRLGWEPLSVVLSAMAVLSFSLALAGTWLYHRWSAFFFGG